MMRRTASEVIRDLEIRVARLEGGRRTAGERFRDSSVIFWGPTKNLSTIEFAKTLLKSWKESLKSELKRQREYMGINSLVGDPEFVNNLSGRKLTKEFVEDVYKVQYDVNDIYNALVKAGFSESFRGQIKLITRGSYGTKEAFEVIYTTYVDYMEQMENKTLILFVNAMGNLEVSRL